MAKKGFIEIDSKDLNKQIQRALRRNPQETVKAVRDCTLDLAGKSAPRAPIESGDLRNDCHADLNGVGIFGQQQPTGASPAPSTRATGTVAYSLPYALRQHEELDYRHDRTDGRRVPWSNEHTGQPNTTGGISVNLVSGGEAKFLERPFDENTARYIQRTEQIPERSLK